MEKDKIRSWRQRVSFALVSHLSSVVLESTYRRHPTSGVKWEGAERTLDLGEMGQLCVCIHHLFLRGEVKNFRPG